MDKQQLIGSIEENRDLLIGMAQAIWDRPELALEERFASSLQADALEQAGFRVQRGFGALPTAIVAEYGSGRPVLGILGEYDALPDLSQQEGPERAPLQPGGPGHGCGHNLLGTAGVGAAIALARAIDAGSFSGTVRYYGCPAEETIVGKTFMARDGAFDDLDGCVTWHPASYNAPWGNSMLANLSVKFRFSGIPAHAASAAELGRSALDAVELMNVGANYLREHVNEKVRIHYAITDGGGVPNTVPETAEVWYMVRAPKHEMVQDCFARLKKIAQGAALMTETEVSGIQILSSVYEVLTNTVIRDLIGQNMELVGPPAFDDADRALARSILDTFAPGEQRKGFAAFFVPPEFEGQLLHEGVAPAVGVGDCVMASSDVADVSWCAPLAQFGAAVWPLGVPTHTWRNTACTRSGIAMHGMLFAAKILAATLFDLFTDPDALARAKAEFDTATADSPYQCGIGPDQQPA